VVRSSSDPNRTLSPLEGTNPAPIPSAPLDTGLRRRCVWQAVAGQLLFAGAVAGVGAQEAIPDLASMSLEQLLDVEVASASRFDQKANHAPAAVQIIDAEEIRAHGWRTLGEALQSLPGLYLSDTGLYTYLGARGQLRAGDYDTRFLLLVDGHRINDPVYSQSPVGADFPLDMALVERIEYVPGPGSAVYGSNAFFGVINVMTRTPRSGHGEMTVAAGNYGLREAAASLSTSSPLGDSLLALSETRSEGRDLYSQEFAAEPSGGVARNQDAERARRLLLRHVAGDLRLLLLAGERFKEDPVAPYGQTFGVPGGDITDRWVVFGAQYDKALTPATQWQAQIDVIDYRYVGNYTYDEAPILINRDIATGQSLVLESRLVTTAFDRHTLVAGVEARLDRGVEQSNFDVDPYTSYLDSKQDVSSYGVFANDEVALDGDWRINAGLRLDRDDGGTVRLSPRLALISAPAGGTTFKAIVGRAYRSPNAYERFYNVEGEDGTQLANPDLGAEGIQTVELFFGRNLGEHTRAELSLYDYTLESLITLVADEEQTLTLENDASGASTGAELSLRHYWQGGGSIRGSYSYSRVRDSREVDAINAPSSIAKVAARIPLDHDLSLAASAYYMSSRATKADRVPSHSIFDVNMRWDPDQWPFSLSAGVRNLFDERYADPAGPEFVQDSVQRRGREFRVELAWRY
jgi:outer membrane receptor protein involved in Fe transport